MDLNSSGSSSDLEASPEKGESTPRRGRRGRGRRRSSSPITPLSDPQVGDIVWAKVKNHRWWPAILVNKEDCGKLAALGGRRTTYFVYWYGDGRVSPISLSKVVDFRKGYHRFIEPEGSRNFKSGVYLAITEFRKFHMLSTDGDWSVPKSFTWAADGFPFPSGFNIVRTNGAISQHVREKLKTLRVKYEDDDGEGNEHNAADSSLYLEYSNEEIDLLHSIRDGTTALEDICLACVSFVRVSREHPLFCGGICEKCMTKFNERYFSIGLDQVAYYCSICMNLGDMMVCSQPQCFRAYCSKCISMKATLGVLDNIRESDPWLCFFCEPYKPEMHGLLKPQPAQWKQNIHQVFHSHIPSAETLKEMPLRILCLDGSCEIAVKVLSSLTSLDIRIDSLFLCNFNSQEVDKFQAYSPKHVFILKSMEDYIDYESLSKITPIQIVIASFSGEGKEIFGSRFFSFYNIESMLEVLSSANPKTRLPCMWVFEAKPPLWDDYNILITRYLQFEPVQHPKQSNLVWTNIPSLSPFLRDYSEPQSQNKSQATQDGEELCDVRSRRVRQCRKIKEIGDEFIIKRRKRKE